ncbi:hypothetical protein PGTUg99_037766 [Puccinia graminis f. sp. tritici]|uniref:Uncharacterized protein n=1 Tax=Puccinia graminis f. sp. tritici TaxID=56615 RepID=A0A5B0RB61_PUCGR|nr:hypothetical protein PGTUg99_037766 [Puccinia graminis f. sp. tritici]
MSLSIHAPRTSLWIHLTLTDTKLFIALGKSRPTHVTQARHHGVKSANSINPLVVRP